MGYDNSVIARRYFEELVSKGNFAVIDELLADDFILRIPTGEARGREDFKQQLQMYRTAFPDMTVKLEEVIVEGDRVICRWTRPGTHKGSLMGIAPTNKKVMTRGLSLLRISGGKVREVDGYWDTYGILEQLGVLPKLQDLATTKPQTATTQPRPS